MGRRRLFWVAITLLAVPGTVLVVPFTRYGLLGVFWHEHFYRARPTSFWRAKLARHHDTRPAILEPLDPVPAFFGFPERTPGQRLEELKDELEQEILERALGQPGDNPLLQVFGSDAAAAPVLLDLLEDPDEALRRKATQALGDIRPLTEAAVSGLIGALADPEPRLRRHAAWALGKLGGSARAAVPALCNALDDGDPCVREAAGDALKKIDPEAAARVGME